MGRARRSLERVSCCSSLSDVYLPPSSLLLARFREQGGSETEAADFAPRKGGLGKPASRKAAFSLVKTASMCIWFQQHPDHHESRMASNTPTCFGEKVAKERRDSVPESGHKIQHFQQAKLLGLMLRPPEQVKEGKRDFPGGPGVKNTLSNVRDAGSIPGRKTKIPSALEQPNWCTATRKPIGRKLWSPHTLEPTYHDY